MDTLVLSALHILKSFVFQHKAWSTDNTSYTFHNGSTNVFLIIKKKENKSKLSYRNTIMGDLQDMVQNVLKQK